MVTGYVILSRKHPGRFVCRAECPAQALEAGDPACVELLPKRQAQSVVAEWNKLTPDQYYAVEVTIPEEAP